jgi:hypothetical protein
MRWLDYPYQFRSPLHITKVVSRPENTDKTKEKTPSTSYCTRTSIVHANYFPSLLYMFFRVEVDLHLGFTQCSLLDGLMDVTWPIYGFPWRIFWTLFFLAPCSSMPKLGYRPTSFESFPKPALSLAVCNVSSPHPATCQR